MLAPFFLFFVICSIPFSITLSKSMTEWSSSLSTIMNDIPEFKIEKGILTLSKGSIPFKKYDEKTGTAVIIDPSAGTETLSGYERAILFSKKTLYVKNGKEIPSMDYSAKGNAVVTAKVMQEALVLITVLFMIVAIPVLLAFLFLYQILVATSAYLFGRMLPEGRSLDKKELFRMAVTASMPMTLVLSIFRTTKIDESFLFIGSIIVSCAYLHFGTRQIKPQLNQSA